MRTVQSLLCTMLCFAVAFACVPSHAITVAPHPRLLLDDATLAALRAKAAIPSVDWLNLKEQCDAYLGG
jgi:hypothetical protein